jgi:hypothetical protein
MDLLLFVSGRRPAVLRPRSVKAIYQPYLIFAEPPWMIGKPDNSMRTSSQFSHGLS